MKTTVICGAGIAGVATAYYLKQLGSKDRLVLVDRGQPLSFTTAVSGENFRDYWPQRCMRDFMGDSLELVRSLDKDYERLFSFKQTGYEFVSENESHEIFPAEYNSAANEEVAIQRIYNPELFTKRPYLGENIKQVTKISRAGSLDVHALGQYLYSNARQKCIETMREMIVSIQNDADGGYRVCLAGTEKKVLKADTLILAGGPFTHQLAANIGVVLPVKSYLQRKIVLNDPLSIIPRDMPFTIFADKQKLAWSAEEYETFFEDPEFQWLTEEFPAGLHIKPESDSQIKLGWAYNRRSREPEFDIYDDASFPDVVIRGASRFIPELKQYIGNMPTPISQVAGYYTRTEENWPLIGRLRDNCYTVTALSGYGTMASCAAGKLCAQWALDEPKPWYGRYFDPMRYEDPELVEEILTISSDGQL